MGGFHSFDGGFHKREAFGVNIALETHEDTVGWQDANDMSLDGFTVLLAGENAVLDTAGEDAGRGGMAVMQGSGRSDQAVGGSSRTVHASEHMVGMPHDLGVDNELAWG